jgi:predicted oxidoreductase
VLPLQPLCQGGPALSPIVAGAWRMGSWNWTAPQRLRWIEACADLGVTSVDHADIYGGYTVEALFGEALALKPGLREASSWRRRTGRSTASSPTTPRAPTSSPAPNSR